MIVHAAVNKYRGDLSIKGQQLMEEIERGEYGTIIIFRTRWSSHGWTEFEKKVNLLRIWGVISRFSVSRLIGKRLEIMKYDVYPGELINWR